MGIIPLESKQKIPSHAKCVFSGILFDVYQWQQKMFDGSYKTFEKLVRPDTVNIIAITKDKKIIIVEQQQPGKAKYISVPSGRVDKNEDILKAAQRELLEETGYVSHNLQLWDKKQKTSKIEWGVYTFIARDCYYNQEQNLDNGEKIKIKKIDFKEFIDLVLNKGIDDIEVMQKISQEILKLVDYSTVLKDLENKFFY